MAEATTTGATTGEVAQRYFRAVSESDLEEMVACWQPGGIEHLVGQAELSVPDGLRAYFSELYAAFPDWRFDVLEQLEVGDRAIVRWRASGTFAGAPFQGLEPTGAHVEVEGCDVLQIRDGRIQRNDAYFDTGDMVRQLGIQPPRESPAEARLFKAINAKTRAERRLAGSQAERVADGVWIVRGGMPRTMNVYLLEDDDGVTVFDAGIKSMPRAIMAAAAPLGGVRRVVLGHGHTDHRGSAPAIGAPVLCHPDAVADAEGDGGRSYWDISKLPTGARQIHPLLHEHVWDGGPVKVSETISEGDEIAGFRVVDLPGHAPGLIGLWREEDRLALVTDCFYTVDMFGRHVPPRVPHEAYNFDTEQARASIRKLAELEPAAAWAGHAEPVTGNVREQLERAAAS